jgi:cytochrome o ubiquinol oxidase subunit 3
MNESPAQSKSVFGFWIYLMTDCILFATLFATFAVLRNSTYGGPSGQQIFSLNFVLSETLILLTSSFTAGLGMISARAGDKKGVMRFYVLTFLLGTAFLALELREFAHLAAEGHSWRTSAFLSAFFTLVGTHGAHITAGLIWMAVLIPRSVKRGLGTVDVRRITCLTLFWHFLDVVWIFIFTIVYLMGVTT